MAGSNINSEGDITLDAKQDVKIITTQETTKTENEETHGSVELSVGVKHQAVEVAYKAKQLYDSIQKLKEAKEAYDGYKESLKKAEQNYKNGIIDKEDYDDMKEDEKYYAANLAVLTADV
ncbi:MAG: hemagglutinin repeat-containing protein, partial [Deltaproteobacteria bacterium]|nr:hemagglutinin repeat-containing protein [Deltaproteobacteria bacterium]